MTVACSCFYSFFLNRSNNNAFYHRQFNSPLAFTLGHEIRKAAYTLNNLLPLPKRMGLGELPGDPTHFANLSENCKHINPNLGDLDGTRIPAKLVERAKGENTSLYICYCCCDSL